MDYSKPKGTFDILPKCPGEPWKESAQYRSLEKILHEISALYGYKEIRTPIFERTELFVRSVGESSDIASKEMYTFEDKAGRSMSLRPEGTASVMRAFIENGLQTLGAKQKFFYIGPFFRYDRPQAGRYRQFHQFGAEMVGDGSPEEDVEMIDLTLHIYKKIGLKKVNLMVNSVGDSSSRPAYIQALKSYLEPYYGDLTEESQNRFLHNPLRILDTKDAKEQQILKSAPSILSFLNPESETHFQKVCSWLDRLNISYTINDKLVRGLDYYSKTVFEVTSDALGAQNSIGAGGRFDGLMSNLGGPALPCIGFATGIERVLQTMAAQECLNQSAQGPLAGLICLGERAKEVGFNLCTELRHLEISADVLYTGSKIGKGLTHCESQGAAFALIIGEQELEKNRIQIKHLATRDIFEKPLGEIAEFMSELKKKYD